MILRASRPANVGLGNEVLTEMPRTLYRAFGRFYLELADRFHALDPNHQVIYREAEDGFVTGIANTLSRGPERPWLLYATNVPSVLRRPSAVLQRR